MISWTRLMADKGTVSSELIQERLRFQPGCVPIVVWNLTRACNLKCLHCYQEAVEERRRDEIETDRAVQVLKDLREAGVLIVLFSGGEPLVRPDLFELIREAKDLGLRPVVSSNGTLIDETAAGRLAEAGCAYSGVSVDGLQAIHDVFRGSPGAFERTLQGLRKARAAGLLTGIRFTLTRQNVQDLDTLLDLVEGEGIPRFCLYHLVYAGRGKMENLDVDNATRRRVAETLFRRARDWSTRSEGPELLSVDNHADGPFLIHRLSEVSPEGAERARSLLSRQVGCPAGCKIACIDPEGWVHPCQFWGHLRLGNVREKSFQEIWSGLESSPLRCRNAYLKGRCGRCRHRAFCGGCRVRAEHVLGDPWQEDPACYLTEEEISAE